MRRFAAIASVAAFAAMTLLAPAADAATANVLTVAYEFVPEEIEIVKGDKLDYTNADVLAPHNVESRVTKRDGNPLFGSATISWGTTAPVKGVEKLGPGAYDFVCSLHPGMTGTIFVKKA